MQQRPKSRRGHFIRASLPGEHRNQAQSANSRVAAQVDASAPSSWVTRGSWRVSRSVRQGERACAGLQELRNYPDGPRGFASGNLRMHASNSLAHRREGPPTRRKRNMATAQHVIREANLIARQFECLGPTRAAEATAAHILTFWAPLLRKELLEQV